MTLNISNARLQKLANELATESGEELTQAVIIALEERMERLRVRRTDSDIFENLMRISKRCSSLPDKDTRSPEEILSYDHDTGIPD